MLLYHGTDQRNLKGIEERGLIGVDREDGFGSVVYMTDNEELASEMGDILIEIDTDLLDKGKLIRYATDEFAYKGSIPAKDLCWREVNY